MRIGAGEVIVQAGIRVAVDAGQQTARTEEQLGVGAEVVKLRFIIAEVDVHLVEQARVVAGAHLQVGVDVVLAHHGRQRAGFVDLEEAAHIVELVHEGGVDFLVAVGAAQQFLAGQHLVLLFTQVDAGAIHPLADVLLVALEQLVKVNLHGGQLVLHGLLAGKGEVALKLDDLRHHRQPGCALDGEALFDFLHRAALGQQADRRHKALVAEIGVVGPGEGDHTAFNGQLMGALDEGILEHHVAVLEGPAGRGDGHIHVQLSLRRGQAVDNHVAVIGGKGLGAVGATGIGPDGGDHAVLRVQPAQVVPGVGLLGLREAEPERRVQPGRAGGVQNLVVKIHVLVKAGLLLGFVQQLVGFLGLAFQQQAADFRQIRPQIRRQGRFLPKRLIKKLLGIGHFLGIGPAGGLHAQRAVAGDKVVRALLRGGDGADAVLRQNIIPLLHRDIGIRVFQLGEINHMKSFLS